MNKGFTLLEMIVAVAIFSVVAVICLTAFLNISDIQRKAEATRAINDNFYFSIEAMVREIKTGHTYTGVNGGSSISFKNYLGDDVTYSMAGGQITRTDNGKTFSLTAPEVVVENLIFFISGNAAGDNLQPLVTIIIRGHTGQTTKTQTRLDLQATVSQIQQDS